MNAAVPWGTVTVELKVTGFAVSVTHTLNSLLLVLQFLSNHQVFEMIINGFLIVLEQSVGVPQAVAGLCFHSSVLQLPSQLQRPPAGEGHKPQKALQGKAFRSAHAQLKICYTN